MGLRASAVLLSVVFAPTVVLAHGPGFVELKLSAIPGDTEAASIVVNCVWITAIEPVVVPGPTLQGRLYVKQDPDVSSGKGRVWIIRETPNQVRAKCGELTVSDLMDIINTNLSP